MSCLEIGGRILPALRSHCESGEMCSAVAAWPVSGCEFGGGVRSPVSQTEYDESSIAVQMRGSLGFWLIITVLGQMRRGTG